MARYEYMKIPLCWFPQYTIDQYKTMDFVEKEGLVYVCIRKGMYVLKKAASIAFDRVSKLLKHNGYDPLLSNPYIWCHETLPTKFAVCVD